MNACGALTGRGVCAGLRTGSDWCAVCARPLLRMLPAALLFRRTGKNGKQGQRDYQCANRGLW